MKKILLTMLLLICAFSFAYADQKNDPWIQWRKGYELFLTGDKHMRRNELQEALSAYKRSRDIYRMVLEANTGWNKNLINSKISACETQILKIERQLRLSDKNAVSAPAKTPAPPSVQPTVSAPASSASDSEYKRKYFNLFIEVENLRKQLRTQSQTIKNIDSLLKEKRIADEKVLTLTRTLENIQKQLSKPKKEMENLRKQLIAERIKNENLVIARKADEISIKNSQNDIKKLNDAIASINKKLTESNNARTSLNDNITALNNRIKTLAKEKSDLAQKNDKFASDLKIAQKNNLAAKQEIKKLNNWIDTFNKKKGMTEKLSSDIVNENRTLKTQNAAHLENIRKLEASVRDLSGKINTNSVEHRTATQNLSAANARIKVLETELKNIRGLYIKQLNSEKLTKAELETLRNANKKHTADLQTYINRNAELSAMLDTKDSASSGYIKKLGSLEKEIKQKNDEIKNLNNILKNADLSSNAKKLAQLNIDLSNLKKANTSLTQSVSRLNSEKNTLTAELNSVKNELRIYRAPGKSTTAATVAVSGKNSDDYQKLLKTYNDLKNKYDFLSAEIESLNKPLAEIGEKEPEINSDKELAKFLLKAASDASKAGDFISAAWYFSELKKQDAKNKFYIYGHAFYNTFASDRANAQKSLAALADSREKFILSGILAMLNGDAKTASAAFARAERTQVASAEALALYRKELPLILGFFDKNSAMQSNINTLKKLVR